MNLLKSFFKNKRTNRISGSQLKIKNQIMAYRWTFKKDPLKLEKICGQSRIKYDIVDYGVTMELQRKSFVEPSEIWPDWLKLALGKELGHPVQKYWIVF